jgi:hypothetical protein
VSRKKTFAEADNQQNRRLCRTLTYLQDQSSEVSKDRFTASQVSVFPREKVIQMRNNRAIILGQCGVNPVYLSSS